MIVERLKVVAPDELFDDEFQRHLHYPVEKSQLAASIISSADDILLIYVIQGSSNIYNEIYRPSIFDVCQVTDIARSASNRNRQSPCNLMGSL